jgi:hypothetical protein
MARCHQLHKRELKVVYFTLGNQKILSKMLFRKLWILQGTTKWVLLQ